MGKNTPKMLWRAARHSTYRLMMISRSVSTETSFSMNGDANREDCLCWTHLAVDPELSSFSEEEDVEEALKKVASVWLGLPARPGLMGEDLSYSGVCFPSWGMLLKLFCSGRPFSAVSGARLCSGTGSGCECWTWRQRQKKHAAVILMKLSHLQYFTVVLSEFDSLTPGFTGSSTCGMLSNFGDGTAAGTPMYFGLTVKQTNIFSVHSREAGPGVQGCSQHRNPVIVSVKTVTVCNNL